MARKYRRSANGRFAGGGGGGSTASKGASSKPKAAVAQGQKQVARKQPKSTARQKAIKFVAKHPRAVIATAYVATTAVHNRHQIGTAIQTGQAVAAMKKAAKYATDHVSDKRGIGSNKPGQGLKAAKKRNGAYKIRSS